MKKNILYLFIAVILLASCGHPDIIEINGELKSDKYSGKYIKLSRNIGSKFELIDSAIIEGKSFTLITDSKEDMLYAVELDNSYRLDLIAKNGDVLNVDINDAATPFITYNIEGNKASEIIKKYYDYVVGSQARIYELQNAMGASADTTGFGEKVTKLQDEYKNTDEWLKNEIKTAPTELLKVFCAGYIDAEYDTKALIDLAKSIKNTENSAYLAYFKANALELEKLALGSPAPSIEAVTPFGKTVSLASFKGKYVLVDFWASWCRPCREENPNVVRIYNKYHSKGFEILGVSLDESYDVWKGAIAKDGLTWSHISELKGWESSFVKNYNISGIPCTYLISPEGNIYAKNLRGKELEEVLEKIYGSN